MDNTFARISGSCCTRDGRTLGHDAFLTLEVARDWAEHMRLNAPGVLKGSIALYGWTEAAVSGSEMPTALPLK